MFVTGIVGREIVRALGQDLEQWTTIRALSHSQKEKHASNVKHDDMNLTGSAEETAKQLKGVEAEYLFFAAYLHEDSEQENWDVNGAMLRNFLDALDMNDAPRS